MRHSVEIEIATADHPVAVTMRVKMRVNKVGDVGWLWGEGRFWRPLKGSVDMGSATMPADLIGDFLDGKDNRTWVDNPFEDGGEVSLRRVPAAVPEDGKGIGDYGLADAKARAERIAAGLRIVRGIVYAEAPEPMLRLQLIHMAPESFEVDLWCPGDPTPRDPEATELFRVDAFDDLLETARRVTGVTDSGIVRVEARRPDVAIPGIYGTLPLALPEFNRPHNLDSLPKDVVRLFRPLGTRPTNRSRAVAPGRPECLADAIRMAFDLRSALEAIDPPDTLVSQGKYWTGVAITLFLARHAGGADADAGAEAGASPDPSQEAPTVSTSVPAPPDPGEEISETGIGQSAEPSLVVTEPPSAIDSPEAGMPAPEPAPVEPDGVPLADSMPEDALLASLLASLASRGGEASRSIADGDGDGAWIAYVQMKGLTDMLALHVSGRERAYALPEG